MFDNNMNNNPNFNNSEQLFGNNENNSDYNISKNVNQSDSNLDFIMPLNQESNILQKQSSDTSNDYMLSDQYNSSSVSLDLPPDLEEIKNLSDANIASAPTLDVLSPMNIMPESLPPKQDLLDAYESGNLNLQNTNVITDMEKENNSFQQNNIQNEGLTNQLIENDYSNSKETLDNKSLEKQNPISINAVSQDNNENNRNFEIFEPNNLDLKNSIDETNIIKDDSKLDLEEISDISSIPEKDTPNFNENIDLLEKETIEDDNKSNTNLEDLGISADFSEPDTLEIMDIDNEDEIIENTIDDDKKMISDNKLVFSGVDKIKNLINELKQEGFDIELEEFDFENMYQLIVKLNK